MSPADDQTSDIDAARTLLSRLGLTPNDLLTDATTRATPTPTFESYIPRVADAVAEGTRRLYRPYWNKICHSWAERRLDEPTALEIKHLAEEVKNEAVLRRNARGGRSAAEHFVAATRCLYNQAIADALMSEADNPARRVDKPRRLPSTRRALPDDRLRELNRVAACTGNDPTLDAILLRLHTETACRRGGALQLRGQDLDHDQCLILLREKGGTQRWQPVSPTLMRHLRTHEKARRTSGSQTQLLRYRDGKPISRRRYDYVWSRLGAHLPWVATQQVSTHWLRHTTLTWVERHFGYAVARAFAGHSDSGSPNATTTYIRADVNEVATAVSALTGETHPLVQPR